MVFWCLTISTCMMHENEEQLKSLNNSEKFFFFKLWKVLSRATLNHALLVVLVESIPECWSVCSFRMLRGGGGISSWLIMFFFEFVFLSPTVQYLHKWCPAAVKPFIHVCLETVSYKAKPICSARLFLPLRNKPEFPRCTTTDEYSRYDLLSFPHKGKLESM